MSLMHEAVAALAVVVALAAAAYSSWSPCGQSMLSQLNPLAERSRQQRYWLTATWFVIGAVAGGLTLAVGIAALALGVDALGMTSGWAAGIAAVVTLLGAASDSRVLPWSPPFLRRQVNEDWLVRYRGWLYGVGFGWQIGTGVTTYIMTAAVFVMVALGALSASPVVAVVAAMTFALARGLVVFATARCDTFEKLAAFHRRFHALGPSVRRAVIAVQVVVAAVAAAVSWGWIGLAGVVVIAVAALALVTRGRSRAGSGLGASRVAQDELELAHDAS
jgi:hypothetical protein